MRKTKIICTLGPATDRDNILTKLIETGMDAARFNFSHGLHDEQKGRFEKLVALREKTGLPIPAILDTKGPEIRLGTFRDGRVNLVKGQKFRLTSTPEEGTNEQVSISYTELPKEISIGNSILIDDGLVELVVVDKSDDTIDCLVKNDGTISDKKGVNIPGVALNMPFISEKDRSDIIFGIENGFDFIAASFVRSAADVLEIRAILDEYNCKTINIISKIENHQGVDNIDEIIEVSDAIMIARGDMGIELPLEEIPVIQKSIIKKVYRAGKQVITATQMLDSMIKNPRPTRAEATDVANAIYDGTSAIMLSGETAAGKYPLESLETMIRITERTEQDIDYVKRFMQADSRGTTVSEAISHATCLSAIDLKVKAIVTVTKSGTTARQISKFRPPCPIIGCTPHESVLRQLNLSWGVKPLLIEEEQISTRLLTNAVTAARDAGFVNNGDLVTITAGLPLGIIGNTNLLKIHVVGNDDI